MDPALYSHLATAQCASIRINNSIQKLKWSSLHYRKNIASVVSRLIRTAHGLRTRTLYSLHPGNRMRRAFRKRRHRRALRCIDLETYLIYAACWYWENLTIIYHPPKTTVRVLFLTYNKYMICDLTFYWLLVCSQPVELDIRQNLPERLYNSLLLFGSDCGCGKIFSHRVRQCTDKQCPYQLG